MYKRQSVISSFRLAGVSSAAFRSGIISERFVRFRCGRAMRSMSLQPARTKKTLQPLTQRRQRPFLYRNVLFAGELRAYDRVCTVSYTHLLRNTKVAQGDLFFSALQCDGGGELFQKHHPGVVLGPVSYTHLDVYKRQEQNNPTGQSRRGNRPCKGRPCRLV